MAMAAMTGAERGEARVAPEPLADGGMTDEAEADRGDRRPQHAGGGSLQHGGGLHDEEDRPQSQARAR